LHTIASETDANFAEASKVSLLFYDLLKYNESTYLEYFPALPGPPLHDPIAVLLTLPEARIEGKNERWGIGVQAEGDVNDGSYGRTYIRTAPQGHGCWVPRSIKQDMLWQILEKRLDRADKAMAAATNSGKI
jgi:hypothetical protein